MTVISTRLISSNSHCGLGYQAGSCQDLEFGYEKWKFTAKHCDTELSDAFLCGNRSLESSRSNCDDKNFILQLWQRNIEWDETIDTSISMNKKLPKHDVGSRIRIIDDIKRGSLIPEHTLKIVWKSCVHFAQKETILNLYSVLIREINIYRIAFISVGIFVVIGDKWEKRNERGLINGR